MSSRQRKQSWKEQRKCTGSTILYYSMMDDWIVFENMQCFWTCVENVPSLCYLPQTSFILLLKKRLFSFVCLFCLYLFFTSVKPEVPYFSSNPCFSPQVAEWYILSSFISLSLAKSVTVFFPCMLHFSKHWSLLVEKQYNVFFSFFSPRYFFFQ